ncbi:MAG: DNA gyrase modulator, partial [Candidatus Bathyarchaeia archaeon]
MFLEFSRMALEEATRAGASYVDVRIGEILDENLTVKNGVPEEVNLLQTKGFGVRAMFKGSWGFAASVDLAKAEVARVARQAVAIAKASARLEKSPAVLT